MEKKFWLNKKLVDMTQEEWEAICDGCGKCCFEKFIDGHGKNTKLYFTRIACDFLNLDTGKCTCYENRFVQNKECTHLTKKNLSEFKWLPETCAYRLLYEGKTLPDYHPLVSGKSDSVKRSGIMIQNPVHQNAINEDDWEDYVISEESC